VYLCPDNIEAGASLDAAAAQPVTCTTDDVSSSDPSSSYSVGKQEGTLLSCSRTHCTLCCDVAHTVASSISFHFYEGRE